MKNRFIPVENILSIYDNRIWLLIPNFNGYEVSNDGYIRSMKHFDKYPYGILIQPVNGTNNGDSNAEYVLSNNNNERVRVKLSHLLESARNNPYNKNNNPIRTITTYRSSRNQKCTIKQKEIQFDKTLFFPKFNIIKEESDNSEIQKICPIESINNKGEYYGRKDNRTFGYINV